jgi:hypothetical protein
MNQESLTAEQLEQLHALILPSYRLLVKVLERMYARGFPIEDPLFFSATIAHDAVGRLLADIAKLKGSTTARTDIRIRE